MTLKGAVGEFVMSKRIAARASVRKTQPIQPHTWLALLLGGAALAAVLTAGMGHALAQDAKAGQTVFNQCKACHQVGPTAKNGVGPMLNGLFGRKSGSVQGYQYSSANKGANIVWDEAVFTEYIKAPKEKIPNTKMAFAGLKDEQKIKDLIAYLHQFDSAPVELGK